MEGAKYNLIYEYYKCHILFGHLRQGDYLPTIEQIRDTFQVAPQTVRNALKKLQEDELIRVSPGRNTIVIYETTLDKTVFFTKKYYLTRKDAIKHVYLIANLLLMPIYHEGCKRLSKDDLLQIILASRQKNANIASISMFCCHIMIGKINNWLAKSLFLDMVSFFQFPYVPSFDESTNQEYRRNYELLLSGCKTENRNDVFLAFTGFQELTHKTLQSYIDESAREMSVEEQIPFHWPTYRGKPQHCYTLAANIIRKIIQGKYSEKDMLPSYESMSEEFAVSINTARRTIGLLRDMGIVRSINGVGNQIEFTFPDWEKLRRHTIQKNVDMARESLEILQLTSEDIIHRCFPILTSAQIVDLKKLLSKKKNGCSEVVIRLTEYITVVHPSDVVIEIYGKLLEPLLLIYPLLRNQEQRKEKKTSLFIRELDSALNQRDSTMFSQGFLELLTELQADVEHVKSTLDKEISCSLLGKPI